MAFQIQSLAVKSIKSNIRFNWFNLFNWFNWFEHRSWGSLVGHWPARCSQERMSNQVHQLNQLNQLHLILCYWFDKWLFKSNPWQSNKLNQILDSIDFKFISGAPGWPVVDQRAPGAMFKSIKSIESMKSIESNNIAAAGAVDWEFGRFFCFVDLGPKMGSRRAGSGLKRSLESIGFVLAEFEPKRSRGDLIRGIVMFILKMQCLKRNRS